MAGTAGSRRQQDDKRRRAESAALELLGGRVATVGDLSDAAQRRVDATASVTAARGRAEELVRAAREEGRVLVEQARVDEDAAVGAYTRAFQSAVDAGWTPAQLADLGYLAPPRRRERRAGRTPATSANGQAPTTGDGAAAGVGPPPASPAGDREPAGAGLDSTASPSNTSVSRQS